MTTMTRRERRERDLMELLRINYILLIPGVQDIAGFNTLDPISKIYDVIKMAERDGFITRFKAGQTFERQSRTVLTNKGIHEVCNYFSLPVKEQFCAGSHAENLARLRLSEPVIRLAPRFFRSGAIDTPFVFPKDPGDDPREVVLDESTSLMDIDWLESTQESIVHSVWWYRTTEGDTVAFPNITVGLHHMSDRRRYGDQAAQFGGAIDPTAGLDSVPAFINGLGPTRIPGLVFIVLDRLAGWFVERTYESVPKAIVDAEGNVIRPMRPVVPMGRIERPRNWEGRVGLPEDTIERLMQEPKVMAMQWVPGRKIFEWVNGIQGCNIEIIAEGVGHPYSNVKAIVKQFEEVDLLSVFDQGVYLSHDGRVVAAKRDRQHPNVVHGRFSALTADDPAHRRHERQHERAVACVASQLRKNGIEVFPGWRLEITYPGKKGTQVRPDLWVLVPLGDGTAVWHALEVERSAAGKTAIDRKLAPHRIARGWGGIWPVLAVAGKGTKSEGGRRADMAAAELFATRGGDLPPAGHPLFTGDQG